MKRKWSLRDENGLLRPVVALSIMTVASTLSFATWRVLLNNFAQGEAQFSGLEIGVLQSLREIPGFLAFTAVFCLLLMREQVFALISLAVLGLGTALTGFFPFTWGLYATTILMSIGFHYFETANQSLSLQWLSKEEAPRMMGRILAAGSFATIAAYALIFVTWSWLSLDFTIVYLLGGSITMIIAFAGWRIFPQYNTGVIQHKRLILRSRYWLYYALTFMSGARRQIFVVFAGFMMVDKFDFSVPEMTIMFLVTAIINIFLAPEIGKLISFWGERRALIFEYAGLFVIFLLYAFVDQTWQASILYIIDNILFALAIALKTYFQKIADPADIAPTAGVAFTINHIAAVVIPALFGLVWLHDHSIVFLAGAAMAGISLLLSLLVPRHPDLGRATIFRHLADRA